jgi:hypothetical protein
MAAKTKTETPKETLTVIANVMLGEDGKRYAPGEAFSTTPERAAALGDHVTIANPES